MKKQSVSVLNIKYSLIFLKDFCKDKLKVVALNFSKYKTNTYRLIINNDAIP